jgi:hypothetical protein
MEDKTHPPMWKTLLAFAIIYFVWGSTFLAIRVGVREVPPFLLDADKNQLNVPQQSAIQGVSLG